MVFESPVFPAGELPQGNQPGLEELPSSGPKGTAEPEICQEESQL